MEWLPIEGAPKRASAAPIITWDGLRVRLAFWRDDRHAKKPQPRWGYFGSYAKSDEMSFKPTHWMPLPSPPNPTAQARITED